MLLCFVGSFRSHKSKQNNPACSIGTKELQGVEMVGAYVPPDAILIYTMGSLNTQSNSSAFLPGNQESASSIDRLHPALDCLPV